MKKPSILLYVNRPDKELLKEICAGIEEEGVTFQVIDREETDLKTLAYEAAHDSILGSGVGIVKRDGAMQMRGIPNDKSIFLYLDATSEQGRILGANSARAVKKLPFRFVY